MAKFREYLEYMTVKLELFCKYSDFNFAKFTMLQISFSNWNKNLGNVFLFIKKMNFSFFVRQFTLLSVVKIITFQGYFSWNLENWKITEKQIFTKLTIVFVS